jgi:hypothetical protein
MKIRPARAEFFHADRRMDGRTDGQTLKYFHNFANTLKNLQNPCFLPRTPQRTSEDMKNVILVAVRSCADVLLFRSGGC